MAAATASESENSMQTPPGAQHDQRQWTYNQAVWGKARDDGGTTMRVMTYNILGDKYAKHYTQYLYNEVPKQLLKWETRRSLLLQEIRLWEPDVICLQEVDHWSDLQLELQQEGYEGTFFQRGGDRQDGCATLWKTDRFTVRGVQQVDFSRQGLKDNVALLLLLRPRPPAPDPDAPAAPSEQGAVECGVVVANTHICFSPSLGQVKVGQVVGLLRAVGEAVAAERAAGRDAVAVVGGDFNSEPESPLYQLVVDGCLDLGGADRRAVSGQMVGSGYKWYVHMLQRLGHSPLRPPYPSGTRSSPRQGSPPATSVASLSEALAATSLSPSTNPRSPSAPPRTSTTSSVATATAATTTTSTATATSTVTAAVTAESSLASTSAALTETSSVTATTTSNTPSPSTPASCLRDHSGPASPSSAAQATPKRGARPKAPDWLTPSPSSPPGWTRDHLQLARGGSSEDGLLVTQPLHLQSSYLEVARQEPEYTTCHNQYIGTVDYLWYTPASGAGGHALHPAAVLQPPPALSLPKGLPSGAYGSDHISLLCDFVLQRGPATPPANGSGDDSGTGSDPSSQS